MLALLVISTCLGAAPDDQPIRVASPGFTVVGMPAAHGETFFEHFSTQLGSQPGIRVTTPKELSLVLGAEKQRQLLGCENEGDCQAEIGAALGSDAMLVGTLSKVGSGFVLNVKLISAQSSTPLAVASAQAANEQVLLARLTQVAVDFGEKLRDAFPRKGRAAAVIATDFTSGPRKYAWVPAVAGGAVVIAGAVFVVVARGQVNAVSNADPTIPNRVEAAFLVKDAQFNQTLGISLLGLGAASLATAALMRWAGPDDATVAFVLHPAGGSFVVSGAFP